MFIAVLVLVFLQIALLFLPEKKSHTNWFMVREYSIQQSMPIKVVKVVRQRPSYPSYKLPHS